MSPNDNCHVVDEVVGETGEEAVGAGWGEKAAEEELVAEEVLGNEQEQRTAVT